MSGPKYYTINVKDEDVNEVYRRLSKFRVGVSVKVVNGKLEFKVSNDAWMRGVNMESLKKEVQKAEREIAEDRRLQELFEKGKIEEKKSMDNAKKSIKKEYDSASETMKDAIRRLEKVKKNAITEISTPFGTIKVAGNNDAIENAISETKAQLEKLEQNKNNQMKACDDYANSIEGAKTPREFNKLRKRRPSTILEYDRPKTDISEFTDEIERRNKRAQSIEDKLNKLDNQLTSYGLGAYRDRIKEKLKDIDLLSDDAPAKLDRIFSEIKEENEVRISMLKKSADDARTRDEIDRINKELVSLGELLKPVKESFEVGAVTEKDNTEENRPKYERCKALVQEIKDLGRAYGESNERLKHAESKLKNLRTSLKSADATRELDTISSDLRKIKEQTEKSVKMRDEFEKATETYKGAYSRYIATLGHDKEVCKVLRGYEVLLDLIYSDDNATEVTEELLEKAEQLNKLSEEVEAAEQYDMMTKTFSFSSEYISSKTDKEGNLHTYFAKNDVRYRGVIFDIVKGERVAILPRRVRLSNGECIITAKELAQVHENCDWSKQMEDDCKELGIPLDREESDKEHRELMYTDAEALQLTEEESKIYLRVIGYTEAEIATKLHPAKKGGGNVTSVRREIEEKKKVQYADR